MSALQQAFQLSDAAVSERFGQLAMLLLRDDVVLAAQFAFLQRLIGESMPHWAAVVLCMLGAELTCWGLTVLGWGLPPPPPFDAGLDAAALAPVVLTYQDFLKRPPVELQQAFFRVIAQYGVHGGMRRVQCSPAAMLLPKISRKAVSQASDKLVPTIVVSLLNEHQALARGQQGSCPLRN